MYVMARAKKGFGPQRIKMELQQKQVGSIEITDAIEAFEGWDEILRHELEKKYKQPTEDFKEIMISLKSSVGCLYFFSNSCLRISSQPSKASIASVISMLPTCFCCSSILIR